MLLTAVNSKLSFDAFVSGWVRDFEKKQKRERFLRTADKRTCVEYNLTLDDTLLLVRKGGMYLATACRNVMAKSLFCKEISFFCI